MEETTSRCTKAMGKGIFVNKKGLLIISSSGGEEGSLTKLHFHNNWKIRKTGGATYNLSIGI